MPTESFAARLLAALLLGAASVLAFAPVGVFPLVWLTLAGLFALLARSSVIPAGATRRGALLGGAFGFGLFIAGVSWVYVSLSTFGGMFPPVAALGTLLFCAVLALFPALAGALFARFMPATGWRRVLFFAALWTLGEWLRGWVLTGFPWLVVGYAQAPPSPLAGFAPVFGVYGVSLLSALLGALSSEVGLRWMTPGAGRSEYTPRWRRLLPLFAVPLLLASGQLLYGVHWTQPLATPLSVSLLQGNVAQDLKWRPESFIDSLRTYYRLAQDNPAQLTVMPETALPAFLDQVPDEYLDELKKLAAREQGDMLFGIVVGNMGRYANAAVSLGQSGEQRYSKSHLVPFGEFVPPGFAWFLALAKIPMSDFMPGPPGQPPLAIAGQTVAVDICYEDAFGEEIIRALPQATLLVNISNVAWFGDSLAPAQHLQIAQLRALESGRMMLRSTNTGMTAIIAADGQVLSALKPFTRGALRGVVHGYQGLTPYARWGNSVVVAVMLLLIVLLRRRQTPD